MTAGAAFAALADDNRRRVVELLSERPRRASELAEEVGLSAPAMSRHLKALKESGLVADAHPDFDARVRIYALRAEGLDALKAWVLKADAMWSAQLSAFKEHVEREG